MTLGAPSDSAKTVQAKKAILRMVSESPAPARDIVQSLVEREPSIGVDRIRAAMWELVGRGDLRLSWEGELAVGAPKRADAKGR